MAGIDEKMTILAMDTATIVSSVAVATKERVLAELTAETRFTHSETLVVNIEEVLRLADVKREELSAVAVSLGPGSFTGLRIGLAAAKAIAYALSIPLVGVPTLEVLAAAFPSPGAVVAPLIDAQKGNAYFSLYRYTEQGLACEKEVSVSSQRWFKKASSFLVMLHSRQSRILCRAPRWLPRALSSGWKTEREKARWSWSRFTSVGLRLKCFGRSDTRRSNSDFLS